MTRRLVPFVVGLLLLAQSRTSVAQDEREVGERSSKATALVLVGPPPGILARSPQSEGSGSAFCVDVSGIFVTNAHVVKGHIGNVTLVIRPGEDDQQIVKAKVASINEEFDLAVLKVDGAKDLVALALGKEQDVFVTMHVTTAGYPFGTMIKFQKDGYPNVSVNVSRVTSLKKNDKGVLQAIQIDNQLNPGNSGGPVVGPDGRVVGVVRSGVVGAAINFAIPVGRVSDALSSPSILFDPPAIAYADRAKPIAWDVRLMPSPFALPLSSLSVTVSLSSGQCEKREVQAESTSGVYKVTAAAVPAEAEPALEITVMRRPGQNPVGYRFPIHDAVVRVGEQSMRLSELNYVEIGKGTRVITRSGRRLKGAFSGLGKVRTSYASPAQYEDLGKADYLVIRPLEPRPAVQGVEATILVKKGDRVVSRMIKQIPFANAPSPSQRPGGEGVPIGWVVASPIRQMADPCIPQTAEAVEDCLDVEGSLDVAGIAPLGSGKAIRPPKGVIAEATIATEAFQELDPPMQLGNLDQIISLSGDGRRILTAAGRGYIRIFDAGTRAEVLRRSTNGGITTLAFLPDGRRYITGDGFGKILLYDLNIGTVLHSMQAGQGPDYRREANTLSLSPDGGRAMTFHQDGVIRLWDLETGKMLKNLDGTNGMDPKLVHTFQGRVAFLADGHRATSSGVDGVVRIWDLDAGNEIRAFDAEQGACHFLAASPDGRTVLASFAKGTPIAFEVGSGKQVARQVLAGEAADAFRHVGCMTFSPDGRLAVSTETDGSSNPEKSSVRVWDVASGREVQPPRYGPLVFAVAFSPDGRSVYQGSKAPNPYLSSWSLEKPKAAAPRSLDLGGTIADVVAGGGGRYLLVRLKTPPALAIFDANAGTVVERIPLPDDAFVAAGAAKFVVISSSKNVIQRWDLATRKKEAESQSPIRGRVLAVGMGSDSAGPIAVVWAKPPGPPVSGEETARTSLISLDRLKVLSIPTIRLCDRGQDIYRVYPWGFNWREMPAASGAIETRGGGDLESAFFQVVASADGRLFTGPSGGMDLVGHTLRIHGGDGSFGLSVPDADGWRWLALNGKVLLADGTHPFDQGDSSPWRVDELPTSDPAYRLRSTVKSTGQGSDLLSGPLEIGLYTARGQFLAKFLDLDEMVPGKAPKSFAQYQQDSLIRRYHYVPAAGLFITIPPSNDRLMLRRLAIDDVLARRAGDAPLLLSPPVLRASADRPFRRQLRVSVKKGSIAFSKDNGPEGLAISKDGLVTWNVPKEAGGTRVKFQVTITHASGAAPFRDKGKPGTIGAVTTNDTGSRVVEMMEILVD